MLLARRVLNGPVVDVGAGVVTDGAGRRGLRTQAQIAFLRAEHHRVEVIHPLAVQSAGVDDPVHGLDERIQRVEPQMAQRHERFDRFQLDLQAHRIAQRAIRIGERTEQVGVLVDGCPYHLAGTGENVHLQYRLVRQAVAERCRLDAQTGDGATERDGLELRHHQR